MWKRQHQLAPHLHLPKAHFDHKMPMKSMVCSSDWSQKQTCQKRGHFGSYVRELGERSKIYEGTELSIIGSTREKSKFCRKCWQVLVNDCKGNLWLDLQQLFNVSVWWKQTANINKKNLDFNVMWMDLFHKVLHIFILNKKICQSVSQCSDCHNSYKL